MLSNKLKEGSGSLISKKKIKIQVVLCAQKVTANNHATFTIQMYVNYSTHLRLLLGHPVCI